MSDVQAIADRVEIEALRGESIDAQMMDDYDRFAALFIPDGVWRVPAVNAEFAGREEIRAGIKRLKEELWDFLVQATHPGTIQLDGDTASADTSTPVRWRARRPTQRPGPGASWSGGRGGRASLAAGGNRGARCGRRPTAGRSTGRIRPGRRGPGGRCGPARGGTRRAAGRG